MTLHDSEYALLGDHLLANHGWRRLALLGWHFIDLLLLAAPPWAQRPKPMRHAPNAVLVRDEDVSVAPSKTVGLVEPFGMALVPFRFVLPILSAQEREVTHFLLGHDHIAVRQHQQATRVLKSGCERRRGKAFRHAQSLARVGQRKRAATDNRSALGRRQVLGFDREAAPDLLVRQQSRIVRRCRCGWWRSPAGWLR